jgi:hypothetical protein
MKEARVGRSGWRRMKTGDLACEFVQQTLLDVELRQRLCPVMDGCEIGVRVGVGLGLVFWGDCVAFNSVGQGLRVSIGCQ